MDQGLHNFWGLLKEVLAESAIIRGPDLLAAQAEFHPCVSGCIWGKQPGASRLHRVRQIGDH